jgi:hypothetical protein
MDETLVCVEEKSCRLGEDNESRGSGESSPEGLCESRTISLTETEDEEAPPKLDHSLLDTSNLDAWQANLDKTKRKFESYFCDDRQLELFCLLPLSNNQRVQLLETLRSNHVKK